MFGTPLAIGGSAAAVGATGTLNGLNE